MSDIDTLDIFLRDLDGDLPYMNSEEKTRYKNYMKQINIYHKKILDCFQDKNDYLLEQINAFIDSVEDQNSLLNDLYYKAGIRLGFSLKKDLRQN